MDNVGEKSGSIANSSDEEGDFESADEGEDGGNEKVATSADATSEHSTSEGLVGKGEVKGQRKGKADAKITAKKRSDEQMSSTEGEESNVNSVVTNLLDDGSEIKGGTAVSGGTASQGTEEISGEQDTAEETEPSSSGEVIGGDIKDLTEGENGILGEATSKPVEEKSEEQSGKVSNTEDKAPSRSTDTDISEPKALDSDPDKG